MRKLWVLGIAVLVLLLGTLSSALLFRTRSFDLGERGTLKAYYFWGQLSRVELDTNRDGVADLVQFVAEGAKLDNIETWHPRLSKLDSNYDGEFDIIWSSSRQRGVSATLYWVDADHDGTVDEVLCGEAGRRVLDSRVSGRLPGDPGNLGPGEL